MKKTFDDLISQLSATRSNMQSLNDAKEEERLNRQDLDALNAAVAQLAARTEERRQQIVQDRAKLHALVDEVTTEVETAAVPETAG